MIEAKFPMKRRMTQKLDHIRMAVDEDSNEYEESDDESSVFGSEVIGISNPSYKTQDTSNDLMKQIAQVKAIETLEKSRKTFTSEELKGKRITDPSSWIKK